MRTPQIINLEQEKEAIKKALHIERKEVISCDEIKTKYLQNFTNSFGEIDWIKVIKSYMDDTEVMLYVSYYIVTKFLEDAYNAPQ